MNILAQIARDPNISPAFRRAVSEQSNQLIRRDAKHRHEQQFAAEPATPSAFGGLTDARCREISADEHGDHLRDVQRGEA